MAPYFSRHEKFVSFAKFVNIQVFEDQLRKLLLSQLKEDKGTLATVKLNFGEAEAAKMRDYTIGEVEQVF